MTENRRSIDILISVVDGFKQIDKTIAEINKTYADTMQMCYLLENKHRANEPWYQKEIKRLNLEEYL